MVSIIIATSKCIMTKIKSWKFLFNKKFKNFSPWKIPVYVYTQLLCIAIIVTVPCNMCSHDLINMSTLTLRLMWTHQANPSCPCYMLNKYVTDLNRSFPEAFQKIQNDITSSIAELSLLLILYVHKNIMIVVLSFLYCNFTNNNRIIYTQLQDTFFTTTQS